MLLPAIPNRARLRSFWLVSGTLLGLAAFLSLGTGFSPPYRIALPLAIGGATAAFSLAPLHLAAFPYRGWNHLVRRFSRWSIRYVTAVSFFVVGSTIRNRESVLFDAAPGRSSWTPRMSQSPEEYAFQGGSRPPGADVAGADNPLAWLLRRGPEGAWAFVPFLWLIRKLDTGSAFTGNVSEHIYTLY